MKKKLYDTIMEVIIALAIALCFILLFACKTPVMIEKETTIDSIHVNDYSKFNYDHLLEQIKSSLIYDFEYTKIEWSEPDSVGGQHKEKEHNLKGKIKATTTDTINKISAEQINDNDSTAYNAAKKEIPKPVKKTLSWWDKFRVKIGNWGLVVLFIGLGYIVIWLVKKKK